MIYRWSGAEGSVDFVGKAEVDEESLVWYAPRLGKPLVDLKKWRAPTVVRDGGSRGQAVKAAGDAPMSGVSNLISSKAKRAISDIWSDHATLYPLRCSEDPEGFLYMVVAKTRLDCLVRERSTGPLQKYGPTPDLFATVQTWEFDEACVGDADLFVLPDSKTTIYVSERFKQRVIEENLKGFCLKTEFWEEDPWIS